MSKSKEYRKSWYQEHRDEQKARVKAWRESHKEKYRDYHRNYDTAYHKTDVNSSGQTKQCIRDKSRYYLSKYGTKIPGYQIHHCFSYNEPYKFIYCPKEIHLQIHAYLREHNIDADSEHYEQIKDLLDDTVILYGISEVDK